MGPVEEVNHQEKEKRQGEMLGKREAPARDGDGRG